MSSGGAPRGGRRQTLSSRTTTVTTTTRTVARGSVRMVGSPASVQRVSASPPAGSLHGSYRPRMPPHGPPLPRTAVGPCPTPLSNTRAKFCAEGVSGNPHMASPPAVGFAVQGFGCCGGCFGLCGGVRGVCDGRIAPLLPFLCVFRRRSVKRGGADGGTPPAGRRMPAVAHRPGLVVGAMPPPRLSAASVLCCAVCGVVSSLCVSV